jgi:hypothetical protein
MRVDRRLDKLEARFGLSHQRPRLLLVVTDYRKLAIDHDACIKILDEAGLLPTSGIAAVYLMDVPRGLNAEETAWFLRENGAKICGSRHAQLPSGVRSA